MSAHRGYESWADYDRRLSAEAGVPASPNARERDQDPEFYAQWLRAACLDFRDVADNPATPLARRRAAADWVRGIAAHFLAITGGDYSNEEE